MSLSHPLAGWATGTPGQSSSFRPFSTPKPADFQTGDVAAPAQLKEENEIIVFADGLQFLDFIKATENRAFFILCDVNMAKINGLERKKLIYDDELFRLKCVPFIFMSASSASHEVMKAYSDGVPVYFIKPPTFAALTIPEHPVNFK